MIYSCDVDRLDTKEVNFPRYTDENYHEISKDGSCMYTCRWGQFSRVVGFFYKFFSPLSFSSLTGNH